MAAAITAIFLYCAAFGLKTPLGNDDIMNLSFAWTPPLRELAAALLVPFSHFYRPTGAALYRLIFHFAGLDASAFRAVFYVLLWINLVLVYRLAARLSGSREVGASPPCSTHFTAGCPASISTMERSTMSCARRCFSRCSSITFTFASPVAPSQSSSPSS